MKLNKHLSKSVLLYLFGTLLIFSASYFIDVCATCRTLSEVIFNVSSFLTVLSFLFATIQTSMYFFNFK